MNLDKTKVMWKEEGNITVNINNRNEIEETSSQIINLGKENPTIESKRRIKQAWRAFRKLNYTLQNEIYT